MATFLNRILCTFLSGLAFYALEATDLGVCGHVFTIEEENLLESLKQKVMNLSKEQVEVMQAKIKERCISQLQTPRGVEGLQKAKTYRSFCVDPALCTERDILNHQGHVIVPKGQCFNPLTTIWHLDTLLFFDGSDSRQLEWAKNQKDQTKWILTKGQPLELEGQENYPVYFDQLGILIKKFGIQALPAKVSQEGMLLKVEEIPLLEQEVTCATF